VSEADDAAVAGQDESTVEDGGRSASRDLQRGVPVPGGTSLHLVEPRSAGEMGPDSIVTGRGEAAISQAVQRHPGVNVKPVRLADRPFPLVGREELLADLGIWLTGGDGSEPRTVALWGEAGTGKTSVAVEYAHRHLAEVAVAWQLPAYDPTVLVAGFEELASQLDARDLAGAADHVASVHAALAELEAGWLLIFDAAKDRALVEGFLPPAGRGQVLITSQTKDWPAGQDMPVPTLTLEVGADFLASRTRDPDRQAAVDLASELGELPLVLEQAAAYTKATGDGLAWYLASFRQRRLTMLDRGEPNGDCKAVTTCWALAFGQLERFAPDAVGLLRLLAFCAPDAIPLSLLLRPRDGLAGELDRQVAAVLLPLLENELAAKDAMDMLRQYSLVNSPVGGLVSVHRLVQAVTREQMPAELYKAWKEAAANVIQAALPKDPEQKDSWPDFAALVPHAYEALTAESDGFERIALYLGCGGSYAAARDLYRKVVDARKILGSDSPDWLCARAKLAEYTGKAGNPVGARDEYAALLPDFIKVHGPEDKVTRSVRRSLHHWASEARLRPFRRLVSGPPEDEKTKRAKRRKAVEEVMQTLVTCEPMLLSEVHGYADNRMGIRSFIDEAAARRARGTDPLDYVPYAWISVWVLAFYLVPLGAWWWFSSNYSFWEYAGIALMTIYASLLVVIVLWRLTPEPSPPGLTAARWLIVVAATAATAFFIVRWHGEHLGGWQVIAFGAGLLAIPANILVTQTRRRLTRARPDQLQILALDFVDLLGASYPAARERLEPPRILVRNLEKCARRVLAASERAAYGWPWTERQVRSQIREFGGSVAAGLRWHKRLVVMPTADASAGLFASFGYGLVAAVTGVREHLTFEPAPPGAQSFWRRYRSRLAFAGILSIIIAITFIFPKLLPGGIESSLRPLLAVTAALSLLKPPGETVGHAYGAFGGDFLGGHAAMKWP
jgi:hypothetical protein